MIARLLTLIFRYMPLLFGVGFLAPLIAQVLQRAAWSSPYGLTPLTIGLSIGAAWGAFATTKGRWL